MISFSSENEPKDLFLDQKFPVGSLVKTKKEGDKTVLLEVSEFPPPLVQTCKKNVWSEEKPDISVPFNQSFLFAKTDEESILPEGYWMKGKKSGKGRIIRWAEDKGISFAILSPFSEADLQRFAGNRGDEMEVKIHRIIRDPVSKNGFALARTSEFEIPIEFSELSLSDYGAGLELIEGKTLSLIIADLETNGFPQLSNLEKVMEDLERITEEVSKSTQRTRDSKKSFIDLQGILVEIIKDQEKAFVAIPRENGVVQVFEVNQIYVPGKNLKYLRLNEEVTLRLLSLDNGVEIDTDCLAKDELNTIPELWKEGRAENKISAPACLADEDLAEWDASPEALDYVKRRSWQYCLQARIVFLKARMSSLKEWMSVDAVVERTSRNEKGETFVNVIFGDNIPGSIPENRLPSSGYSEGDELSLCITSLDPLRLADRDTEIRQKEETIARWRSNISKSKDYISNQEQQRAKIQANMAKNSIQLSGATSPKWIKRYKQWIAAENAQITQKNANIMRARQQIAEQEEKISSVLKELKRLKK